jgi:hypothetical protein
MHISFSYAKPTNCKVAADTYLSRIKYRRSLYELWKKEENTHLQSVASSDESVKERTHAGAASLGMHTFCLPIPTILMTRYDENENRYFVVNCVESETDLQHEILMGNAGYLLDYRKV